jgi:hypothetical protein
MNKILLLSITIIFFYRLTFGQDMIIRNSGDTLNCTVTKIDSNMIYVKFKSHDQIVHLSVDKSSIKEFIVPVFPDDSIRLSCETNIRNYSLLGTASGISFIAAEF